MTFTWTSCSLVKNLKPCKFHWKYKFYRIDQSLCDVTLLKYGGRGREGEEARFFLNLFSVYFQDIWSRFQVNSPPGVGKKVMASLLCVKQPGGKVSVHSSDVVDELMIDSKDHIRTMVRYLLIVFNFCFWIWCSFICISELILQSHLSRIS